MNRSYPLAKVRSACAFLLPFLVSSVSAEEPGHEFNGPYDGPYLDYVAFPIGGIGAGMFCLEGTGAISQVSVYHRLDFFREPCAFAALCVVGESGQPNVARVLEGPLAERKYFGYPKSAGGMPHTTYGLPRFRSAEFLARFPFGSVKLNDAAIPFEVEITGWSPFTPRDPDNSSLPVGALEYRFRNKDSRRHRAVFSFNTQNFMTAQRLPFYDGKGSVGAIENGFVLYRTKGEGRGQNGAFAFFVRGKRATVDHCWFRGGWWDDLTITWDNVEKGRTVDNPPMPEKAPGASLFVPLELEPGEEETIELLTAWYVPTSGMREGSLGHLAGGAAFSSKPARGTGPFQQRVSGYLGKGLANTFNPGGDEAVGRLTSPPLTLSKRYIHLLVGGGDYAGETCVNLMVDERVVLSAFGKRTERLEWKSWDVSSHAGKEARIQIVDTNSGTNNWGHILADHIVLSDEPIEALRLSGSTILNAITDDRDRVTIFQDFEGEDYGEWVASAQPEPQKCDPSTGCCPPPTPYYLPWYATRFKSMEDVASYWRKNYDSLRQRSALFRDSFYDSTLPPEVLEAIASNLAILKTPTVLRQHDGRLYGFEGCHDTSGCCEGSCTHVWNYAQAIPHLFPSLERTLRQTEYHEALAADGRQAYRSNLPITPGGTEYDASDGQLGGVMKVYRDWRISGDTEWMRKLWPRVKRSLEYAIRTWDPRETGTLDEKHFNTYDISYYGPDSHCTTFYLGALAAASKMGKALGEDVERYRGLLEKGRKRLETELYNGDYFIQIVMREGLKGIPRIDPAAQSAAYHKIVEQLNREGPKYQYGTGCLSDGVLGLWMARVCGMDDVLCDPKKVESHLRSVHRYNLKPDLSRHANPQRPSFAMGNDGGLLLCSWPRGGKPTLPFVYSNEVWTGIEYQVAAHLMLTGQVREGLEIVRTCRRRYDGRRRNPFDEYECGHYYARAMSSYSLLEALTGVRYDAVTGTLHVDSKVGDFRSFLSTAYGFGTVELKGGEVRLEVKSGKIPAKKVIDHERKIQSRL